MYRTYNPRTLLGNWFEERYEPSNAESFDDIRLPTPFARTYITTYGVMGSPVSSKKCEAKFRPPAEDWLSGGTDPIKPRERFLSTSSATYSDPRSRSLVGSAVYTCSLNQDELEKYRQKWTSGDSHRFKTHIAK